MVKITTKVYDVNDERQIGASINHGLRKLTTTDSTKCQVTTQLSGGYILNFGVYLDIDESLRTYTLVCGPLFSEIGDLYLQMDVQEADYRPQMNHVVVHTCKANFSYDEITQLITATCTIPAEVDLTKIGVCRIYCLLP